MRRVGHEVAQGRADVHGRASGTATIGAASDFTDAVAVLDHGWTISPVARGFTRAEQLVTAFG
jgi:hypothetical protein